ncbi:pimeloyl-ACP methyl ester carboxylesterase [Stackebrandtia albiflava]|uniref:Pimeloyl-ACP methyl ester carboxylesterase n=1 Tax=Stackebrandtia albiflava TaxID=406432 RepID=A0A562VCK4_9ACTN|nr:alpha/beta fold hydrolase [Stackebrandtia albiflava]TWJ15609.1 pimeloyl-ACP methyl ester carboxylesterase [Stackebrandtia albiflava]
MILFHDVAGDGPPIVLLHSSVCDRRMWDAQVTRLSAAGHRVVCPDFRGHGDTPVPAEDYADAEDVRSLLDHLDLDRVTLVGSSFGGRVAQQVAGAWPERVERLLLLCPAPLEWGEQSAEMAAFETAEENLLAEGRVQEAAVLNADTWLGPEAGEAARVAVIEMQRHAFEVQLAAPEVSGREVPGDPSRITARTLAIGGRFDLPDLRAAAAGIPEVIPGAEYRELDWAGHLPSLERPDEITGLIAGFAAD